MSETGSPTARVRDALAPAGKLRVGLNIGGPTHVIRDSVSGEMTGVGFDLGTELAKRLGVPIETVMYTAIGDLVEGGRTAQWDIAFIGIDPLRETYLDFTSCHLELEVGYLVPAGSPIAAFPGVDQPGVRIAVPQKGHADIILSRALRKATLVRGAGIGGAARLLSAGEADVVSANKANLYELAQKTRGSRVLEGRIGTEQLAMAMPRGRDDGLAYARQFIEEAKSTGLVKAAIERVGLRGAV